MTATWAKGVILGRENDVTPGTYDPIADITNITPLAAERDDIDTTSHSTANNWRTFTGGLVDAGEVEAEINYDPDVHDVLLADFDVNDPINYRVTYPNGATVVIAAILTGFEVEAPHDDKLAATLTWKLSGKPTLTPAP